MPRLNTGQSLHTLTLSEPKIYWASAAGAVSAPPVSIVEAAGCTLSRICIRRSRYV